MKTYNELPKVVRDEMFARHTHTEDGLEIIYTEKAVIDILDLALSRLEDITRLIRFQKGRTPAIDKRYFENLEFLKK